MTKSIKTFIASLILATGIATACSAMAAPLKKLDKPPLSERWFGIYMDNERVGFYRQIISETPGGYRMEGDGNVHMRVMGSNRDATMHEVYTVDRNLALRKVAVEQTINGESSSVTGDVFDSTLRIESISGGKKTTKPIKFKGAIYPGPALNLYPLMREISPNKVYKITTFDAEELKSKEVKITVMGEENTPDGRPAIKLRNTLYPFVTNDIWMDAQGNTLLESVRDGLVITRAEDPRVLAEFVSTVAISRKDLIYDFSLVRAVPPIKDQAALKGLVLEISGWNDAVPLMQSSEQVMKKTTPEHAMVYTGSAMPAPAQAISILPGEAMERYLKGTEKIEAEAPEIVAKSREISAGKHGLGIVRALSGWTSEWLKDTVEDGGGALASLATKHGNCQTHARLYTALARAAGIPTRFVSGLVSLEGKGFLYHSWAESFVEGQWTSVDPTYNQIPADPTHIKLFEGNTQEDMAPIIAIIGRISITVHEAKY